MCPIDLFPLIAIHLSPLIAIHLSPSVAGWCPALRMSPMHLSPFTAIHMSPSLAGGVGSLDVSNSFVSSYSNSLLSQCSWVWLAVRMSPIDLFPVIAINLSPSLAGGFRLSICLTR